MTDHHKITNYITSGKTWFNNDLKLTRLADGMVEFKIKKTKVVMPSVLFEKFKTQVDGSVSYKGQKVTFPKMKVKDGGKVSISITTADKKVASCEPLWFCHYNTSVWYGLVGFLNNYTEIFSLATCPKENAIAITSSFKESFENRENRYDRYDNSAIPEHKENLATLVKNVEDFLKYSDQPLLIESREKIEKILGMKLPDERVFDFSKELNLNWEERDKKILTYPLGIGMIGVHQRLHAMNGAYFKLKLSNEPQTVAQVYSDLMLENIPTRPERR